MYDDESISRMGFIAFMKKVAYLVINVSFAEKKDFVMLLWAWIGGFTDHGQ
jgi:hypothetical protein